MADQTAAGLFNLIPGTHTRIGMWLINQNDFLYVAKKEENTGPKIFYHLGNSGKDADSLEAFCSSISKSTEIMIQFPFWLLAIQIPPLRDCKSTAKSTDAPLPFRQRWKLPALKEGGSAVRNPEFGSVNRPLLDPGSRPAARDLAGMTNYDTACPQVVVDFNYHVGGEGPHLIGLLTVHPISKQIPTHPGPQIDIAGISVRCPIH